MAYDKPSSFYEWQGEAQQAFLEMTGRAHAVEMALEALIHLAGIVIDSPNPEAILTGIVRLACETLQGTSAYISHVELASGSLALMGEYHAPEATPEERKSQMYSPFDLKRGGSGVYEWLKTGEEHHIFQVDDPALPEVDRTYMQNRTAKSVVGVKFPLPDGGIGLLRVWETRQRREFSLTDILILKAIGAQAGIALANAYLHKTAQESTARYRDLFENAYDLIQSVDAEGRFQYVNRRWLETLGYTEAEVAHLDFLDVVHPDNREQCQIIFESLHDGEVVPHLETVFMTKAGDAIPVEGSFGAYLVDGKFMATRAILRDISERKRAAEATTRYTHELVARNFELELLNEVAVVVASTLDLGELLTGIAQYACLMVESTSAHVVEVDSITGHGKVVAEYLSPEASIAELQSVLGETRSCPEGFRHLRGWLLSPDHAHLIHVDTPQLDKLERAYLRKAGIQSALRIPLMTKKGIWGYIVVCESRRRREFSPREIYLLNSIAHQVSLSIANARLHQELQESETRFRSMVENLGEGLLITDAEDRIAYVNPRICEMTGHSETELLGKLAYQLLLPPAEWDEVLERNRQRMSGIADVYETSLLKRDGSAFWARIHATPYRNSKGEIIGTLGAVTDITRQKRVETQLQQRGAQMRAQYNNIPLPTYTWQFIGGDLVLVDFNVAAGTSSQGETAKLLWKGIREVFARYPEVQAAYRKCYAEQTLVAVELPFRWHWNQEEHYWHLRLAYVPPDVVVAHVEDITDQRRAEQALRESEQRYRSLFEGMNDPVFVHDNQARILDVNEAASRALGYTREELLQMKITDIDAPEYAAGFAERLQDQLEDGYLDNISGVHIAKDGRHIDIDVRSTMIDYRGQRVVLAVTRDITYLKRVEEAERNRRQLAEALLDSVVALNTTLKLDEVLNRVLTNLQNLVPHQAANIMLIEEEVAHLVAWHGYEDLGVSDEAIRHLNFVVAETPNLRHMIDTRDGIIIANTAQDSLWIETPISQRFSSVVGIPIELDGKVIGFLHLESIHQDFFATIDLRHLQTFGNLAAIAIKNARAFEQAQELAVVEERQRLARDLHDAVSQTLFSASMISETLPRLWDQNPAQVKPLLEELHQMTRGALAEMRTLLVELRPTALIEAQFSELVKQLTSALVGRAPVKLHLEVLEERSLPPDVQVALYRIMQEAVHNIAKHARASEVWVEASLKPAVVTLRIVDNGRGFDAAKVSPERFGVGIMGERARAIGAQLEITSTIKQGTEVKVTWLDPQGDAQK